MIPGEEQVALVPVTDPSGAPPVAPPDTAGTPPTELPKEARDRLAMMGRRAAAAEAAATEAQALALQQAQTIAALENEVIKFGRYISSQERASMEARLSTMPKEEQNAERIKMLESVIAQQAVRSPAPAPAPRAASEDGRAYAARRSREILADVNDGFGLEGEEAISLADERIDWTNEASFKRSVFTLAQERKQGGTMAAPTKKEEPKEPNKPIDEAALRAQIAAEERAKIEAEMGIGRPNSPRPTGRRDGAPATSEDYQKVNSGYDSRLGPRANLAKLKALRGE